MAYDEGLARRVRGMLEERPNVSEMTMLGGLAFLVEGNVCVGVLGRDLMVQVGPGAHADALRQPHAREVTGRTMKGFVCVEAKGLESDVALGRWMARGVSFVSSLPAR